MASLTLDWLHIIVLLGAVQGVVLTGALVARRRNRTANRLLGAAMFAFSVGLATSVYQAAGFIRVAPHFFGAAFPLPFLIGPLIYLYAVAAADRSRRPQPPARRGSTRCTSCRFWQRWWRGSRSTL